MWYNCHVYPLGIVTDAYFYRAGFSLLARLWWVTFQVYQFTRMASLLKSADQYSTKSNRWKHPISPYLGSTNSSDATRGFCLAGSEGGVWVQGCLPRCLYPRSGLWQHSASAGRLLHRPQALPPLDTSLVFETRLATVLSWLLGLKIFVEWCQCWGDDVECYVVNTFMVCVNHFVTILLTSYFGTSRLSCNLLGQVLVLHIDVTFAYSS